MTDRVLYVQSGPIRCQLCEATKTRLQTSGVEYAERAATSMHGDALADRKILDALHGYWWHNGKFPEALPILIDRVFCEVWDSDDLADVGASS